MTYNQLHYSEWGENNFFAIMCRGYVVNVLLFWYSFGTSGIRVP